jgi:hypothetical protein
MEIMTAFTGDYEVGQLYPSLERKVSYFDMDLRRLQLSPGYLHVGQVPSK